MISGLVSAKMARVSCKSASAGLYAMVLLYQNGDNCSSSQRREEGKQKQPNQQKRACDCRSVYIRYLLLILLDKHL